MPPLVIRCSAERELSAAARWYECERAGLGPAFLASLDAVVQRIGESPEPFPLVDGPVRRALLRRFPFAVYFRADQARVEVLAVLHLRRDPSNWSSRKPGSD